MRRIIYILILIILLIMLANGCNRSSVLTSSQPNVTRSATAILDKVTITPQILSNPKNVYSPEPTIIMTSTVVKTTTSTPTVIPTIKPTFDGLSIHTATLAKAAECPPVNNSIKLVIKPEDNPSYFLWSGWKDFEITILDYLNNGGSYENMMLDYTTGSVHLGNDTAILPALHKDITNDGTPEIIVINPANYDKDRFTGGSALYVFGCDQGKAKILFFKDLGVYPNWHAIQFRDINANDVPDIFIEQKGDNNWEQFSVISLYEWNDSRFTSLLSVPYFVNQDLYYIRGQADLSQLILKEFLLISRLVEPHFRDLNNDAIPELIVNISDIRYSDGPSRSPTIIYAWDGQYFTLYRTLYPSPIYRYQAVQDADSAALFGEYEKALDLYQTAISDQDLLWYSSKVFLSIGEDWYKKTPAPVEYQNPKEYPLISAYSSYRIMLIHVLRGDQDAALAQYNKLIQDHPSQTAGHPFTALATEFFVTYQQTKDLATACSVAINYAARHSEILSVLGDKYHGEQSQRYIPVDVCPYH